MKKKLVYLMMALTLIWVPAIGTLSGCDGRSGARLMAPQEPTLDQTSASDNTYSGSMRRSGIPSTESFPLVCVCLPVPWIPQVPPGDWSHTKNCGQACSAMLAAYHHRVSISSATITRENRWLAAVLRDNRYNNPNGYYTYFGGANPLGKLLADYHHLNYEWHPGGGTASMLINAIVHRRPVLVGVRISGGNLVGAGRSGVQHWVIASGWDALSPTDGYIYLNDPGTDRGYRRGDHIRYRLSTFMASWATSGYEYAFTS